jgi:hypothetical protein
MLRNIYTGKLAHVVTQGRHRVTVRLPDGSLEEWLIDETEASQLKPRCRASEGAETAETVTQGDLRLSVGLLSSLSIPTDSAVSVTQVAERPTKPPLG